MGFFINNSGYVRHNKQASSVHDLAIFFDKEYLAALGIVQASLTLLSLVRYFLSFSILFIP